jgi:hypothetical protein
LESQGWSIIDRPASIDTQLWEKHSGGGGEECAVSTVAEDNAYIVITRALGSWSFSHGLGISRLVHFYPSGEYNDPALGKLESTSKEHREACSTPFVTT